MIRSGFAIISTPDLERSLTFWRDLLGGVVVFAFPDDGPPGYVSLELGAMRLGIGLDDEMIADEPGQRLSLWVYVEHCDATVDALRAADVRVKAEPADQPWGERMARVLDPDGNDVVIATEAIS